jgi:hypothetical protein
MPPEQPTPITPEGKRAAQRVRTIFYAIAAANIALAAIVMWQRNKADKKHEAEPPMPAAGAK